MGVHRPGGIILQPADESTPAPVDLAAGQKADAVEPVGRAMIAEPADDRRRLCSRENLSNNTL